MTLAKIDFNNTPAGIRRKERILGNIRMGDRGGKNNAPRKLTTFRITSSDLEILHAIARRYGGEVTEWDGKHQVTIEQKKLHVLVPPITSYKVEWSLWSGPGKCDRRCDGTNMSIANGKRVVGETVPCLCGPEEFERACKPHIRAKFILDGLGLQRDGVWVLDSHGFNAAGELPVTMDKLTQFSALLMANQGSIPPGLPTKAGGYLWIDQRKSKSANGVTRQFTVPVLDPDVSEEAVASLPGYAEYMRAAYGGRSLPAAAPTFAEPPALEGETHDFEWGSSADNDEREPIEVEARIVEEPEDQPEFSEPSVVVSADTPEPQPDRGAMQHYIIVCKEAGISDEQQKEWLEVTAGITSRKDATKEQFTAALEHGLGELKAEAAELGKRVFGVTQDEKMIAAEQMSNWIGKSLKDAALPEWAEIVRKLRESKPPIKITEEGEEQELPW